MKLNAKTADLAARKVIVAAFCYYVLDDPIMSDARYDKLSQFIAKHWADLNADRRWALGSARDTRAGGSHIKYTVQAANAAVAAYRAEKGRPKFRVIVRRWRETNKGRRYATAVDFAK